MHGRSKWRSKPRDETEVDVANSKYYNRGLNAGAMWQLVDQN